MAVPGYVLKNKRTTLERAEKFISRHEWTDCNLFGRLYKARAPVKSIIHYAAPDRINFVDALRGLETEGQPVKIGQSFGPTWATHWFRVEYTIPSDWRGQQVRFTWNSNSEALLWVDSKPVQGFTNENRRTDYILTDNFQGSPASGTVYVEMACNKVFGAGKDAQIGPPDPDLTFSLDTVQLVVLDPLVFAVFTDLENLTSLAKHLPEDSNRSLQALYTANHVVTAASSHSTAGLQEAHEIAERFFNEHNGASQHIVHAVGNCHIDSAWLWTYAETIRKCARSFASTIRLLERYPDFTFACSQAQQFAWMKHHYPALYADMKAQVRAGRFIPVGAVWVEMDGLMPSGESNIRQFLYGQKFFEKEFGFKCQEFWLPDTFGYSGQLPQILRHVGLSRFVTQKMSWCLVNKFPHHTFHWHGIDGSSVLAHFPPADSYTNMARADELLHSVKNFRDKGRSNASLFLYGYGDGGQGPTEDMIERLQRLKDTDGCPKVKLSSPDAFFSEVEHFDVENLCHWQGELYLELHNGTYTSQAKTKAGNRRGESLLHSVEALAALACLHQRTRHPHPPPGDDVTSGADGACVYPRAEVERLWKLLLLNQFHDVLPGSSIGAVYTDALAYYIDIETSGDRLLEEAMRNLLPQNKASPVEMVCFNTLGWARTEVVELPAPAPQGAQSPSRKKHRLDDATVTQVDFTGKTLALATVPSYGYTVLTPVEGYKPVCAEKKFDSITLSNEFLSATLDSHGRLTELYSAGSSKNAIAEGCLGNQLVMFDDVPLYWDAWDVMDYHLETRKPVESVLQQARLVEEGPLRATVQVTLKLSDSSLLKQCIVLDAAAKSLRFTTEVNWHESHRFLKVEFPLRVRADSATYEIAYGHLQRPTHFNTSWDWAKFEVCGHRWADVSEYGFGVSVLNDNKYGWSCINNVLRLSLLRSPKAPDEKCDMGTQTFTYAVMPHQGTFQSAGVIQAAHALNIPLLTRSLRVNSDATRSVSCVSVSTPQVVLDTVKLAEESDSALVLRLYEAFGGTTQASVMVNSPVKQALLCNGLEDVDEPERAALLLSQDHLQVGATSFTLTFQPFQIHSVKVIF